MLQQHHTHKTLVALLLVFAFILSVSVLITFFVYYKNRGGSLEVTTFTKSMENAPTKTTTGQAEVSIMSDEFSPSTISISRGWQVTWVNNDSKPHRIATDPYPAIEGQTMFDSEALAEGESFSYTFNEAGTYTYHDNTNPLEIKGTIIVN